MPADVAVNIALPLGALLPLKLFVHVEPGGDPHVIVIVLPTVAVELLAEIVALSGETPDNGTW